MNPKEVRPWAALSWPNRISILRLLLVPPFVVLLLNQRDWSFARYTALGIFVLMAMSDLVDGLFARQMNAKTRLGAILDPLADKSLIICSVVLLSLPHSAVENARLDNWVVVAVVGKDLWVVFGFLVIYLVTDRFRIQPTLAGKACTLGQLLLVGLVLIAPDLNRLLESLGTWLARTMGWLVMIVCVLAVISYTRLGLSFLAQEQKPLEDR